MMSYSEQQREAPADAPAMTAAEWQAYQAELYDNPGHDATPGYCLLCEDEFTADDPAVDTTWGSMHRSCCDSHDSACGELLDGEV